MPRELTREECRDVLTAILFSPIHPDFDTLLNRINEILGNHAYLQNIRVVLNGDAGITLQNSRRWMRKPEISAANSIVEHVEGEELANVPEFSEIKEEEVVDKKSQIDIPSKSGTVEDRIEKLSLKEKYYVSQDYFKEEDIILCEKRAFVPRSQLKLNWFVPQRMEEWGNFGEIVVFEQDSVVENIVLQKDIKKLVNKVLASSRPSTSDDTKPVSENEIAVQLHVERDIRNSAASNISLLNAIKKVNMGTVRFAVDAANQKTFMIFHKSSLIRLENNMEDLQAPQTKFPYPVEERFWLNCFANLEQFVEFTVTIKHHFHLEFALHVLHQHFKDVKFKSQTGEQDLAARNPLKMDSILISTPLSRRTNSKYIERILKNNNIDFLKIEVSKPIALIAKHDAKKLVYNCISQWIDDGVNNDKKLEAVVSKMTRCGKLVKRGQATHIHTIVHFQGAENPECSDALNALRQNIPILKKENQLTLRFYPTFIKQMQVGYNIRSILKYEVQKLEEDLRATMKTRWEYPETHYVHVFDTADFFIGIKGWNEAIVNDAFEKLKSIFCPVVYDCVAEGTPKLLRGSGPVYVAYISNLYQNRVVIRPCPKLNCLEIVGQKMYMSTVIEQLKMFPNVGNFKMVTMIPIAPPYFNTEILEIFENRKFVDFMEFLEFNIEKSTISGHYQFQGTFQAYDALLKVLIGLNKAIFNKIFVKKPEAGVVLDAKKLVDNYRLYNSSPKQAKQ
ncbi:unnamed protein product [Caenorhabditis bovis]|uniref:Uncharacterized protein n=1 Tax=Caenorhabditis bovis TaxID=2654633 RepID=A0A8S1FEN4_9PELO|nr:unnamed protein product [Caenorhabditis bovis]